MTRASFHVLCRLRPIQVSGIFGCLLDGVLLLEISRVATWSSDMFMHHCALNLHTRRGAHGQSSSTSPYSDDENISCHLVNSLLESPCGTAQKTDEKELHLPVTVVLEDLLCRLTYPPSDPVAYSLLASAVLEVLWVLRGI